MPRLWHTPEERQAVAVKLVAAVCESGFLALPDVLAAAAATGTVAPWAAALPRVTADALVSCLRRRYAPLCDSLTSAAATLTGGPAYPEALTLLGACVASTPPSGSPPCAASSTPPANVASAASQVLLGLLAASQKTGARLVSETASVAALGCPVAAAVAWVEVLARLGSLMDGEQVDAAAAGLALALRLTDASFIAAPVDVPGCGEGASPAAAGRRLSQSGAGAASASRRGSALGLSSGAGSSSATSSSGNHPLVRGLREVAARVAGASSARTSGIAVTALDPCGGGGGGGAGNSTNLTNGLDTEISAVAQARAAFLSAKARGTASCRPARDSLAPSSSSEPPASTAAPAAAAVYVLPTPSAAAKVCAAGSGRRDGGAGGRSSGVTLLGGGAGAVTAPPTSPAPFHDAALPLTPGTLLLALDLLVCRIHPSLYATLEGLDISLAEVCLPWVSTLLLGSTSPRGDGAPDGLPFPSAASERWVLLQLLADGWLGWLRAAAAVLLAAADDLTSLPCRVDRSATCRYLRTFPRRAALTVRSLSGVLGPAGVSTTLLAGCLHAAAGLVPAPADPAVGSTEPRLVPLGDVYLAAASHRGGLKGPRTCSDGAWAAAFFGSHRGLRTTVLGAGMDVGGVTAVASTLRGQVPVRLLDMSAGARVTFACEGAPELPVAEAAGAGSGGGEQVTAAVDAAAALPSRRASAAAGVGAEAAPASPVPEATTASGSAVGSPDSLSAAAAKRQQHQRRLSVDASSSARDVPFPSRNPTFKELMTLLIPASPAVAGGSAAAQQVAELREEGSHVDEGDDEDEEGSSWLDDGDEDEDDDDDDDLATSSSSGLSEGGTADYDDLSLYRPHGSADASVLTRVPMDASHLSPQVAAHLAAARAGAVDSFFDTAAAALQAAPAALARATSKPRAPAPPAALPITTKFIALGWSAASSKGAGKGTGTGRASSPTPAAGVPAPASPPASSAAYPLDSFAALLASPVATLLAPSPSPAAAPAAVATTSPAAPQAPASPSAASASPTSPAGEDAVSPRSRRRRRSHSRRRAFEPLPVASPEWAIPDGAAPVTRLAAPAPVVVSASDLLALAPALSGAISMPTGAAAAAAPGLIAIAGASSSLASPAAPLSSASLRRYVPFTAKLASKLPSAATTSSKAAAEDGAPTPAETEAAGDMDADTALASFGGAAGLAAYLQASAAEDASIASFLTGGDGTSRYSEIEVEVGAEAWDGRGTNAAAAAWQEAKAALQSMPVPTTPAPAPAPVAAAAVVPGTGGPQSPSPAAPLPRVPGSSARARPTRPPPDTPDRAPSRAAPLPLAPAPAAPAAASHRSGSHPLRSPPPIPTSPPPVAPPPPPAAAASPAPAVPAFPVDEATAPLVVEAQRRFDVARLRAAASPGATASKAVLSPPPAPPVPRTPPRGAASTDPAPVETPTRRGVTFSPVVAIVEEDGSSTHQQALEGEASAAAATTVAAPGEAAGSADLDSVESFRQPSFSVLVTGREPGAAASAGDDNTGPSPLSPSVLSLAKAVSYAAGHPPPPPPPLPGTGGVTLSVSPAGVRSYRFTSAEYAAANGGSSGLAPPATPPLGSAPFPTVAPLSSLPAPLLPPSLTPFRGFGGSDRSDLLLGGGSGELGSSGTSVMSHGTMLRLDSLGAAAGASSPAPRAKAITAPSPYSAYTDPAVSDMYAVFLMGNRSNEEVQEGGDGAERPASPVREATLAAFAAAAAGAWGEDEEGSGEEEGGGSVGDGGAQAASMPSRPSLRPLARQVTTDRVSNAALPVHWGADVSAMPRAVSSPTPQRPQHSSTMLSGFDAPPRGSLSSTGAVASGPYLEESAATAAVPLFAPAASSPAAAAPPPPPSLRQLMPLHMWTTSSFA